MGRILGTLRQPYDQLAVPHLDYLGPAMVGYGFSLPYNLLALVGVWRSAGHYTWPQLHADLARGASLVLLGILSVT